MRAHIEPTWQNGNFAVWLYTDGPGPRYMVRFDDGTPRLEPWSEGQDVDPSLHVTREMLEAIMRASGERLPPEDATRDALKDARAIRDRLLALVEHTIHGDDTRA